MTARCPQCDKTEQECADYIAEENQLMRRQGQVFLDARELLEARELALVDRLDVVEAYRDELLEQARSDYRKLNQLTARLDAVEAERDRYRKALADLHAEVEMAESVGICLPDRVPSLRAGAALAVEAGRT